MLFSQCPQKLIWHCILAEFVKKNLFVSCYISKLSSFPEYVKQFFTSACDVVFSFGMVVNGFMFMLNLSTVFDKQILKNVLLVQKYAVLANVLTFRVVFIATVLVELSPLRIRKAALASFTLHLFLVKLKYKF